MPASLRTFVNHRRVSGTSLSMGPAQFLSQSVALLLVSMFAVLPALGAPQESEIPERPNTEELLPETVVAFVQVDNFKDLIEKMRESAGGQLIRDEAVAPLVEGLWEDAQNAYDENVKEEVGLELKDLTGLPEGELTFAVIAPRRKNPEFFLLMELSNENEALDRVLNRGREIVNEEEESGGIQSEISEDGFEIERFKADDRTVYFFRHENTLVGCTSEDELNAFIDRWMEREVEKVRPLSANRKFVTIMNRCLGTDELKPEARFFVDPITLAKSSTRGNIAAQATINFLPLIGLDGLLGIGGSMLLSEDDYESVVHGHILLSNPRKGVFEMLSMKPTQYEPDSWLPAGTNNYWTTSWDVRQMFAELTKMIEMAQGEGVVAEAIENNVNQELDIDFEEDVLGSLDGRITFAQWMEPPARLNSNVTALAMKLDDIDTANAVLGKFIERINRDSEDENIVEFDYKGFSIWSEPEERAEQRMERMREFRERRREQRGDDEVQVTMEMNAQSPAMAIIGDSLVLAASRNFLEAAIDTELGDLPALRDDEDFREIQDEMAKLLKNELPVAMFYQNPEETMKTLMEVAKSQNTKELLAQGGENSEFAARLGRRLEENPLPDYDSIAKYFTKSGGFATSDDTGYHFLFFNLRPELDEK